MIIAMIDKTFPVKDLLSFLWFLFFAHAKRQNRGRMSVIETDAHSSFVFIGLNKSLADILLFPLKQNVDLRPFISR